MVRRKRKEITTDSTFNQACDFYLDSHQYLKLNNRVQKMYEDYLKVARKTAVHTGKQLGNFKLSDMRYKHFERAYETWQTERGITSSNHIASSVSVVLNMAIRNEAITTNYMGLVPKTTPKPRRVKWKPEQIKQFLNVAYSKWDYRSVGLIVHMGYEWGQRIGDMRTLTWDSLDLDAQRLDLVQSKRGVDVHIPISDNLTIMLQQQKKDFGFQDYVAPRVHPRAGAYTPYDLQELSSYVNRVKEEAGLPAELQARDMRRTAITEMVEAGVDLAGIMQVSGHQSPASVTPYMVNTFSGAKTALDKRWGNK